MPEYCVTGGTGLIASNLVKSLLDKGHTVRATVRDPEDVAKVGFLWELNGAKERLKLVKCDLMVDGSFDEAVQGVDGVFHTACPVFIPYDDNVQATLIDPCIKGTLNVLRSCSKSNTIKRVVLTSSISAVRYRSDIQQVSPLNESHWTDIDYCLQRKYWYAYAKTRAEKEAWKFAEENGIDLVVVNPSFNVGRLLAPQPNSSLRVVLSIIKGERDEYPNQIRGFVHIDDVIATHLLAMEKSEASGRLICTSSVVHWSEIIEMLRAKYPSYPFVDKCNKQEGVNVQHCYDTSKISDLGLPAFKTISEMFDDCIKSFQERGIL